MAFKKGKCMGTANPSMKFPMGGMYSKGWPLNGKGSNKGFGSPMLNKTKGSSGK